MAKDFVTSTVQPMELGSFSNDAFESFLEAQPEIKINFDVNVKPPERFPETAIPIRNYLSALKSQLGDADAFSQFERFFSAQNAEMLMVKRNSELLRNALNKSQEDRRNLELQLVAEKALRDQETKNAQASIENNTMQLNAQIYAMKFEVETWKQKAEGTTRESHLLKEQLKVVEAEKSEASRQLSETSEKSGVFENYRKSFELYAMRIRDTIQDLNKQLCEVQSAREELANLLNCFQKEVNMLNVYVKSQAEQIAFLEHRAVSMNCKSKND